MVISSILLAFLNYTAKEMKLHSTLLNVMVLALKLEILETSLSSGSRVGNVYVSSFHDVNLKNPACFKAVNGDLGL